ncbi:MAG: DUF4838 domain-containing protein [Planctomycetota bacterium]
MMNALTAQHRTLFFCGPATGCLFLVLSIGVAPARAELTLVEDGAARSAIVVPSPIDELQEVAVTDFVKTIRRASGAEIPVIEVKKAADLPESTVRIVLGPSPLAEQLGCKPDDLKPEEYRIQTVGNTLVILARDIHGAPRRNDSLVTTWALSYLLENYLGVRWLWPGELGTVVPQSKTICVPAINVRMQPKLVRRAFNIGNPSDHRPGSYDNLKLWAAHHQVAGQRIDYRFSHSFRERQSNGDWWGRFHESHPEYIARGPDGKIGCPNNQPDRVKVCISNPGVTEEILRLWEAAGRPDFWDVTPNDGNGFCTCDDCRALDREYGGVEYTQEEIWERPDHVSLTDRYVWFWNQLIRKMRQRNPYAKIGVYFYSAYRDPPKKLRLEEGIVGEIVHGFDFDTWRAWQAVGAREIGLRPNWWHMGANAPHLPLHKAGRYLELARENGMGWIKMDSLMEYWAAQGPYYYLVARLVSRPEMSSEEVITEYCDAYGAASKDIRRYIDFWEAFHERVAYNVPAGGALSQDPKGLYECVCRQEFGDVLHPLAGHWKTLPKVYTPEVLAEAHAILEDAQRQADTNDTRRRIEFLREGLTQLSKTAAIVASPKSKQQSAIRELADFTEAAWAKYGYWGQNGLGPMKRRGVLGQNVNLEGL